MVKRAVYLICCFYTLLFFSIYLCKFKPCGQKKQKTRSGFFNVNFTIYLSLTAHDHTKVLILMDNSLKLRHLVLDTVYDLSIS